MQRLDKGEIFCIVAADYGVEKKTVGNWRRNRSNLERFASNARGAMTNRKATNLAEYDKIKCQVSFFFVYNSCRITWFIEKIERTWERRDS